MVINFDRVRERQNVCIIGLETIPLGMDESDISARVISSTSKRRYSLVFVRWRKIKR
jgi:hypothetical protein